MSSEKTKQNEDNEAYILNVSEKLPVSKFRYWKKYNTAPWLLLPSYFWSTTDWFGEIKYSACSTHAFYVLFAVFKI